MYALGKDGSFRKIRFCFRNLRIQKKKNVSHHLSVHSVVILFCNENEGPQSKYIFQQKRSTDQTELDGRSFQSIILATLQRARQDRKIEVSCSRGRGEIEVEVK